jgi:hypothetical protein
VLILKIVFIALTCLSAMAADLPDMENKEMEICSARGNLQVSVELKSSNPSAALAFNGNIMSIVAPLLSVRDLGRLFRVSKFFYANTEISKCMQWVEAPISEDQLGDLPRKIYNVRHKEGKFSQNVMARLASRNPEIRRIDLTGVKGIDLSWLALYMPNLTSIALVCAEVDNVPSLAEFLKLEDLYMRGATDRGNDIIEKDLLSVKLPKLRTLHWCNPGVGNIPSLEEPSALETL